MSCSAIPHIDSVIFTACDEYIANCEQVSDVHCMSIQLSHLYGDKSIRSDLFFGRMASYHFTSV